MLQTWYNGDYKQMIDEAVATGTTPGQPDAYTINGHLGDTYGCPNDTIFRTQVNYGCTHLLRIINAAMNELKLFSIANHTLTLVAQDTSYVKRFTSDYMMINPGQTMDVLVVANQNAGVITWLLGLSPMPLFGPLTSLPLEFLNIKIVWVD
ncbi:putative laccase-5 [Hibiscus syriacus]|uniref:putative laccase-5 n=1 Tax=Hibiscus syriacus TaxID=106335 RepID=UPI0019233920|nr:putative laccase-5 [Hibiscus syriacus]